jgi:hypothetical protein
LLVSTGYSLARVNLGCLGQIHPARDNWRGSLKLTDIFEITTY